MKILLIEHITEARYKSFTFNTLILKELVEKGEDFTRVNSIQSAEKFLHELSNRGKYIDLIVLLIDAASSEDANKFGERISYSSKTYFHGFFNLSQIPINVAVIDRYHAKDKTRTYLFSKVFSYYLSGEHFINAIGLSITEWRQKLAGELDDLNLGLEMDFRGFNSDWAINHKLHGLKILTKDFLIAKRRFSFLWLGKRLSEIDYTVGNLQKMMRSQSRYKEKDIHRYLKEHERLLLGEYKDNTVYEQHLYYRNSRKYIEVDFLNFPFEYYFENPEVFEVKRYEKKLFNSRREKPYAHTNRYIKQVDKYYKYLTDPENSSEIKKKLETENTNFDYTMLFSRNDYWEEFQYEISKDLDVLDFNLRILTYDQLIERFERLYERTKRYGVN